MAIILPVMMDSGNLDISKNVFSPEAYCWGTRTYVMGILNITPDSFSGDGLMVGLSSPDPTQGVASNSKDDGEESKNESALQLARGFVTAGVDIVDVGGESTRPGSHPVSIEDEISRVIPVIRSIKAELDVLISIDTYKSSVAEAAIRAGANIINDVWGFKADPELAYIASQYNVPVILMHNRSKTSNAKIQERLGGRYVGMAYDNLLEDVKRELLTSVALAKAAGITDEHIILDPGIGFGKTVEQNLELLNRLDEIRSLGYPVLCGPSRKSFIGYTLGLPPNQRLEGTAAAVAISIARGADIIRVHDVEFMVRVVRMTDAIVRNNAALIKEPR
jgi:dihydropteroate synthase